MTLITVVLDWILMILDMSGKIFYLQKLVREDTSILMDMMKFLIANDVVSSVIILIHDIPSYFMEHSLSELVYPFQLLGTFAQCLPFFYALLMLPVFSILNLVAIIAVYRFVSLRRTSISQIAIISCYVISIGMTIPLLTNYFGFSYNSQFHYWNFDFSKPYTAEYQRINGILQIICITIVVFCMTIVLLFLAKRTKNSSFNSNNSTVAQSVARSSKTQQSQIFVVRTQTTTTNNTQSGTHEVKPKKQFRQKSVVDQAFAFCVISMCFIVATLVFNFVHCEDNLCMVLTIITSNLSRSKWIIYCFLMRQDATISRFFKKH